MEIITVAGIGIVAAVLAVMIKQYRPEFAMLLSLGAGVVIFVLVAKTAVPILEQIQFIAKSVAVPDEYLQIVFKSIGIVFITQIGYESCKDAGESSLATKIEMAGKFSILAVSLPLFSHLLNIVLSLVAI